MKPWTGLLLGLTASTVCNGSVAFLQQQSRLGILGESAGLFKSSSSTAITTTVAISAWKVMGQRVPINSWDHRERGGVERLRGSAADASSAPLNKKGKDGRASVKKAVELWSENSLELHRFNLKRVHVCNAETLPEILIEFWKMAAECAQAKFAAMADDRDYAAHVLFVVPWCDLLKDYGMMRHLDKVLDFCSGGCRDFGRTVTLQHYHPKFSLPRSQGDSDDRHSNDLARVVNFSRSPYPAFGLTVAGGSAARSDPLSQGDKIGRLRLDLEMVYNSVAGCSTDDNVDAHGSEHGTIPSSPEEVEGKTSRWLKSFSERPKGERQPGWVRVLDGVGDGDVVTSGLSTPEEVLSQIWSIVSQLQAEVKPILSAEEESHSVAIHGGGVEGGDNDRDPLASTLLVAPRLHPFNSAQFEHFASNLAIALKQTPIIDRFEVEAYHPEYVCDSGIVDPDRRSPFPTLLIKHCGLKDELFEPSGLHRHTVPPLELPVEAVSPSEDGTDDSSSSSSPENSRPGLPTDDTEI